MKCEWDNCDDEALVFEDDDQIFGECGFCGKKLCEYHMYDSPTHDALDQSIIDADLKGDD